MAVMIKSPRGAVQSTCIRTEKRENSEEDRHEAGQFWLSANYESSE